MQRLHRLALCALVVATVPSVSWGQTSSSTCYLSLDGGALGLNLPAFRPLQQSTGLGDTIRFIESDSGDGYSPLVGGKLGWTMYEPSTLNGIRVEARGFYSKRSSNNTQTLPAGTTYSLIDGSAFFSFIGPPEVFTQRDVTFITGDMLLKCDMSTSNSLIISPYAGLSVMNLRQRFDLIALGAGDRMELHEQVNGTYYGGTAGIELLSRIMPTTVLSVDAGVSLFEFTADRDARQIDNVPPAANVTLSEDTQRATFAANLRVELSQELRWCQLVIFGSAQYIDDVPDVSYGRVFNGGTDVERSRLTTSDAFGFTGGFSMRIPF